MPRTRPPYPPEFRAEAVELIRSGTKSIREVSRDLGVTDQTLGNWVRQTDIAAGRRHDGVTSSEREELRRLRSENRTLRMERELLKNLSGVCRRRRVRTTEPRGIDRSPGCSGPPGWGRRGSVGTRRWQRVAPRECHTQPS